MDADNDFRSNVIYYQFNVNVFIILDVNPILRVALLMTILVKVLRNSD